MTFEVDDGDGGGDGGCPYVSSWDGQSYVHDNNILPTSEASDGEDVADYYVLQQTIHTDGCLSEYWLRLEEFEGEHSWIDCVSLLTVDHPLGTHLAVSPDGQFLTFREPASPVLALDSDGNILTRDIGEVGGSYFHGHAADTITISFPKPGHTSPLKLVIRADMKDPFGSIEIQVPSGDGWARHSVIHPRELWAYEIVSLDDVNETWTDDIVVRLVWTAEHKLDFIGLDTSDEVELQIRRAQLLRAVDNDGQDVRKKLRRVDQHYFELLPGDFIDLAFKSIRPTQLERDYVFHAVGHYLPAAEEKKTANDGFKGMILEWKTCCVIPKFMRKNKIV